MMRSWCRLLIKRGRTTERLRTASSTAAVGVVWPNMNSLETTSTVEAIKMNIHLTGITNQKQIKSFDLLLLCSSALFNLASRSKKMLASVLQATSRLSLGRSYFALFPFGELAPPSARLRAVAQQSSIINKTESEMTALPPAARRMASNFPAKQLLSSCESLLSINLFPSLSSGCILEAK